MTRVMASGVFDIVHTGHISYLEQAKSLGDELVVVVACDETVRSRKHEPITPQDMRVRIIQSLKPVDQAIVGGCGDMLDTVAAVKPDIIVLGFDQNFDPKELEQRIRDQGLGDIRVIRASECADDLNATRRIVAKIRGLSDTP